MRKILIAATMAAVSLAVPSLASATVSVDSNYAGSVGKGDVQTTLGYANDGAFQADASNISFSTGSSSSTLTWHAICGVFVNGVSDPSTFTEVDIPGGTITTTTRPNVTTLTNRAGKVTGYTLTGGTTTTTSGSQNWSAWATGCPAGTGFARWPSDGTPPFSTVTVQGASGLQVSNGVKTVALPNSL
jgi:hypothetical protein